LADHFVLVRIVNMRGVDLNVFDFDFDLTWAGFFMNADDHVYGRYGSQDEGPAEAGLSLDGLKYAMQQALNAFQQTPHAKPAGTIAQSRGLPARVENYPAASRIKNDACIHCHQVHNFQQELYWSKKKWSKDNMWLYPPPKTIGLDLEIDQGDKVESVKSDSSVSRTGLQRGDVLKTLNGIAIASTADVQYALNKAPKSGSIPLSLEKRRSRHDRKYPSQSRLEEIGYLLARFDVVHAAGVRNVRSKSLNGSEERTWPE
jgi:serine protease Do